MPCEVNVTSFIVLLQSEDLLEAETFSVFEFILFNKQLNND